MEKKMTAAQQGILAAHVRADRASLQLQRLVRVNAAGVEEDHPVATHWMADMKEAVLHAATARTRDQALRGAERAEFKLRHAVKMGWVVSPPGTPVTEVR